jgi:hypothetical protein
MSQERHAAVKPGIERRRFLQGAGLAAGGAAAAAATAAVAAEEESALVENPQEQAKARYRETPEVRRFYALNRL